MAWSTITSLKGPQGDVGATGVAGKSVTSASIDGDGHLILTMSDATVVDAGSAKGPAGGGIDFESSVATFSALPTDSPFGEARYVQDVGRLYVYEAAADRVEAVDGWTDVGPIRGEQGDVGASGADGVSVVSGSVNGAYELVLTLSSGGTSNAGNVRGPVGANGSDGLRGTQWYTGAGVPPASIAGSAVGDLYLDTDTGTVYKLA